MKNEKRKAKKIGVLTSEYKNKNLRFCTDSVPGSIAVYVHFQKGFPCFLICLIHYIVNQKWIAKNPLILYIEHRGTEK